MPSLNHRRFLRAAVGLTVSVVLGWIGGTAGGLFLAAMGAVTLALAGLARLLDGPDRLYRQVASAGLLLVAALPAGVYGGAHALAEARRWCERYAFASDTRRAQAPSKPSKVDEVADEKCSVVDGFESMVLDVRTRRWTFY